MEQKNRIECSCNPFTMVDNMPINEYGEKCLHRNEVVRTWFAVFAAGQVIGTIASLVIKYYLNEERNV